MEGEVLASILQQIEELQSIHEKEIKALSELQAKRQETQQQKKQATDVVEKLKATLKTTVTASLEKEREILTCDIELTKLAEELHNAEQENKRLLDEKRGWNNLIAKQRDVAEKIRDMELKHTNAQRQGITITTEYAKRQSLKTEQERFLAKIEELRKQEAELQQVTEDVSSFQEAQAKIADYHEKLAKKVQQKEAVLNEDMDHAAKLWRFLNQCEEGLAMGREDLLATTLASADTSVQVAEVERNLEQLQKL